MELAKEKRGRFLQCLFCCKEIFFNICILFQCLLNKLSEYLYFYISKHITYTLLLPVFKIAKSLQCILNIRSKIWWRSLPKYNDFRDLWTITIPAENYLLKGNNGNRAICEISSKATIIETRTTSHISHVVVFLLLTFNK